MQIWGWVAEFGKVLREESIVMKYLQRSYIYILGERGHIKGIDFFDQERRSNFMGIKDADNL